MDNRQGRKTGWTIIGCGCVFIILSKLWIGLLMAALGILLIPRGAPAVRRSPVTAPLFPRRDARR